MKVMITRTNVETPEFKITFIVPTGEATRGPYDFLRTRSTLYEDTDMGPAQVANLLKRAFKSGHASAVCGR